MKRVLCLVAIIMIALTVQAQEEYYMDGILPDDGTYDKLAAKKEMLTRGYESLPVKFSLSQYCPAVNKQSLYSTCTGWASAYAAHTIAEAVRNGWTDRKQITNEAFSPIFVYAQIKGNDDPNCSKGSHIHDALNLMQEVGNVKKMDFNYLCAGESEINETLLESAKQHRMDSYSTLFNLGEKNAAVKVRAVKKSLSENCPVIIAMWLDRNTFFETKSLLDLSTLDDSFPMRSKTRGEGYHAMCVVGYDDELYGGAFQIMNSWGSGWGEKGFFWAKYDDFARTVDQAYEITLKPLPKPTPAPEPKPEPEPAPVVLNEFAAKIEMKRKDGDAINTSLNWGKGTCYYQLYGELHCGDMLKMFISNNEQAYVYVFSSDLNNSVNELFPRPFVLKVDGKTERKNYNPLLSYKSNNIALPNETDDDGNPNHSIRIDDNKGMEYWCVLYSKVQLDFDAILDKVKSAEGSFYEKVQLALGDKMVRMEDVRYVLNRIEFSARSEQEVVPIIIEAVHN